MVHSRKPEFVVKGGEKDEEIIQGTDDTGIISRNMRYS